VTLVVFPNILPIPKTKSLFSINAAELLNMTVVSKVFVPTDRGIVAYASPVPNMRLFDIPAPSIILVPGLAIYV